MSGRTALITGGAGFIGHHLAEELLRRGWAVVVFDKREITADMPAARCRTFPSFGSIRGDLTDAAAIRTAVERVRPQVVFHLAALHFIPYCQAHPAETLAVNVLGTQHLFDALGQSGVEACVIASTADVYTPSARPHRESDPIGSNNIYGMSKICCEELVALAGQRHPHLPIRIARLFNVFGPEETNPHLIPDIIDGLHGSGELTLGDLRPARDFVHVRDVVDALRRLAGYDGSESVFNVGTGVGRSVGDVVAVAEQILGRRIPVTSAASKMRTTERMTLTADASRAAQELGWRPTVEFAIGLRELVEREAATRVVE